MRARLTWRCSALVVAALGLTACGAGGGGQAAPSSTVRTTTTAAPGAVTSASRAPAQTAPARTTLTDGPRGTFPVTVHAGNGEVTIPAAPHRIVSLSASLTEMAYAVGAGPQFVAVDKYSNYPPHVPSADLSGFKPNVEAVAALAPDLVLVSGDRDGVVAALGAIGVPTLLLAPPTTVDDALAQLVTVGTATGHASVAGDEVVSMRARMAALTARVPEREAPLTYYVELADDGHSATSATFLGNVLGLAGLRNIADGAGRAAGGYPQLSAEAVLAADPDVVFLAHSNGQNPTTADVATRPGWSAMEAVRTGHVVPLDPDIASRWGPRLVDLLGAAIDATAGLT